MPIIRIVIAARKGGVGKTTLCTGLASVFAAAGKQTAVVDLDPQSNAAFALGVDPTATGAAALLLGHQVTPLEAMENLWVYPGGPHLTSREVDRAEPEDLLDRVSTLQFDVVLFDCPPGSEHLERLALVAANVALLALDAHPFGISGASRVLDVIANRRAKQRPSPAQVALVASRIDLRRSVDRGLGANLNELIPGLPVLRVRQDLALATAAAEGIPITKAAPVSRALEDLTAIKEWIDAKFK